MAYKKSSETGMFDQEFTIEALSGMGNPLSALRIYGADHVRAGV